MEWLLTTTCGTKVLVVARGAAASCTPAQHREGSKVGCSQSNLNKLFVEGNNDTFDMRHGD